MEKNAEKFISLNNRLIWYSFKHFKLSISSWKVDLSEFLHCSGWRAFLYLIFTFSVLPFLFWSLAAHSAWFVSSALLNFLISYKIRWIILHYILICNLIVRCFYSYWYVMYVATTFAVIYRPAIRRQTNYLNEIHKQFSLTWNCSLKDFRK